MDSGKPQLIYYVWIWLSFPPKHAFALVQTQCGFPLSAMLSQSAVIICTTTTWMFRASIICWLATSLHFIGISVCNFDLTVSQGLSSEDDLVQLYLLVASNIEGWVDVSQKVCKILVCNGMLLQNVNHLLLVATLPQTDTSEVSEISGDRSWTKLLPNHYFVVFNCTTIGNVVLLFYIHFQP